MEMLCKYGTRLIADDGLSHARLKIYAGFVYFTPGRRALQFSLHDREWK